MQFSIDFYWFSHAVVVGRHRTKAEKQGTSAASSDSVNGRSHDRRKKGEESESYHTACVCMRACVRGPQTEASSPPLPFDSLLQPALLLPSSMTPLPRLGQLGHVGNGSETEGSTYACTVHSHRVPVIFALCFLRSGSLLPFQFSASGESESLPSL
jgi:hypothetical protein